MFAKFWKAIKDFFSGAHTDRELERYISSKNPQSASEVEQLEREFWDKKIRKSGYV